MLLRVLLPGVLCAQDTPLLPPDLLRLSRIRERMARNLDHLPNYTCRQTIQRSRRRAPSRRFEFQDTLRLEVALVEGKELFAWPGAARFEDRDIAEMVGGGAIGNGSFALHARSVFLSNVPAFTWRGEEIRSGRVTLRYDFKVPQFRSGYTVKVGQAKAIVGYHGSFWVDETSLDLIRLEIFADDIPPYLPLTSASDAMEYRIARIGESDFNLPASSELVMVDTEGGESRNVTQFNNCRQYSGESTLSFAEAPTETAESPAAPLELRVPAGVLLDTALDGPIDSANAAAGDEITATLRSAVKKNKQVLVPKGAVLHGRITRLAKRDATFLVSVDFQELTFEHSRATLKVTLSEVGPILGMRNPRLGRLPSAGAEYGIVENDPSGPTFFVRAGRLLLPRGTRLVFETAP
jgi:hypothetical protein